MEILCPLCEAPNDPEADACASCGMHLGGLPPPEPPVQPLAGLERWGDAAAAAGLSGGRAEGVDVPGSEAGPLELETTQLKLDTGASRWEGSAPDLEMGREADDGVKTALPPPGLCPFCGAAVIGAICDACGRRSARYVQARAPGVRSARPGDEETVVCPACFARVEAGPRCPDCGVPFAVPALP